MISVEAAFRFAFGFCRVLIGQTQQFRFATNCASSGEFAEFSGQLSSHLLAQLSDQLCIQLLKYLSSKVFSQLCKVYSQLFNQ
jgi:hypothetical protein